MFHKAERRKAKLRLALTGPSGSGKTYGAIEIAKGIGGKIAMLDTENGSGELYASLGDYDVCTLRSPYSPKRYIEIIKEAEKENYDILIIDSLSHAWNAEGGVLDIVNQTSRSAKYGNNSYYAWRDATPQQNALVYTIISSSMHIIATMRSKTEYIEESNGKSKNYRKIGLAPIQRAELEYEFTTVFDISTDGHVAIASKDRSSLYDERTFVITPEIGIQLKEWLEDGKLSYADEEGERIISEMRKCNTIDELKDIYRKSQQLQRQYPHRLDLKVKFASVKDNIKYKLDLNNEDKKITQEETEIFVNNNPNSMQQTDEKRGYYYEERRI